MREIGIAVYWVDGVVAPVGSIGSHYHISHDQLDNCLELVKKLYKTSGITLHIDKKEKIGWNPATHAYKDFLWTTNYLVSNYYSQHQEKPGFLILGQSHSTLPDVLGEMYDVKKRSGAVCFLETIKYNLGISPHLPQVAAHEIGHMLNLSDPPPSRKYKTSLYTSTMDHDRTQPIADAWNAAINEANATINPYFYRDASIEEQLYPLCYESRKWLNNPGSLMHLKPWGGSYKHSTSQVYIKCITCKEVTYEI